MWGAHGEEIVRASASLRESGWGNDPRDAPSRDAIRFGGPRNHERALAKVGKRDGRDVGASAVEDVFVDLVRDEEGVVVDEEIAQEHELLSREDLACGVVGRVEDDGFSFGSECLLE